MAYLPPLRSRALPLLPRPPRPPRLDLPMLFLTVIGPPGASADLPIELDIDCAYVTCRLGLRSGCGRRTSIRCSPLRRGKQGAVLTARSTLDVSTLRGRFEVHLISSMVESLREGGLTARPTLQGPGTGLVPNTSQTLDNTDT